MASAELVDYYRRRAREYEAIYAKPERQADLQYLRNYLPQRFAGHRVLEIACGTGYWTVLVAATAASVVGVDAAEEPMRIAMSKDYGEHNVRFELADAYALSASLGRFDAALAVFWWSHIPLGRIGDFLASLHGRLETGARVLLMDNRYVDGSSTPICERDAEGNTYQLRRLADGSENRVLKNFPTEAELRAALAPYARDISYRALEYYWLVEYQLRNS
ncbi:MAG: class I SAM-dependent methyltransferase [Betaproteobacteria bacterium]|nr:MAG: class I SAM-dependent methyltransferase [Betaproteobacteria bacterium]